MMFITPDGDLDAQSMTAPSRCHAEPVFDIGHKPQVRPASTLRSKAAAPNAGRLTALQAGIVHRLRRSFRHG
jgi:hypothetical protein